MSRGLFVVLATWTLVVSSNASVGAAEPRFFVRNTEVPFSYVHGGHRSWPIFDGRLRDSEDVQLVARHDDRVLAEGKSLEFDGLSVSVSRDGKLTVASSAATKPISFQLQVRIPGGETPSTLQELNVRAAPPPRPISYVADLVDDIIRIYWDPKTNRFRRIEKDGFDQYFRRLQAHGISRLVVWQSPFPYMSDPQEFAEEDWQRYESQARAIIENRELLDAMRTSGALQNWAWVRQLLALRLSPEFGEIFTTSAAEHDIALTASFRPFEHALTKYYEVPAFAADGTYLWGFLPLASPVVNYHPDRVGFAHYREVLSRMGKPELGIVDSMSLANVKQAARLIDRSRRGKQDLEITASSFPPLDGSSYVLVRGAAGRFQLRRFGEIHETVHARRRILSDVSLSADEPNTLRITDVNVPEDCRYLIVSAASDFGKELEFPADPHVSLRAQAGNRIGRTNVYWALDESEPNARLTRVGGILSDGGYRAEFQATENSISALVDRKSDSLRLGRHQLVIDLGPRWSVEMVDFQQTAARKYALAQLHTMLAYPAFDEILVNTRSHTQLAASAADGVDGLGSIFAYRRARKKYFHLGIDRAFAPRGVAGSRQLRDVAQNAETVEKITLWQAGEWQATCQSEETPFSWRYARNRAVAQGARQLLIDLEKAFPGVRIRAVIPHSSAVEKAVKRRLADMPKPEGGVYGSDYFRHIWSSNNHIPAIGEGMSMVDLSGLRTEPIFLGIRYAPGQGPLESFVGECLADLAGNRGSGFRGPRSFFYEAQETLRGDRETAGKRRDEIIRYLLSKHDDINEVLLYEAADWAYYLPLSDPHGHLSETPTGEK